MSEVCSIPHRTNNSDPEAPYLHDCCLVAGGLTLVLTGSLAHHTVKCVKMHMILSTAVTDPASPRVETLSRWKRGVEIKYLPRANQTDLPNVDHTMRYRTKQGMPSDLEGCKARCQSPWPRPEQIRQPFYEIILKVHTPEKKRTWCINR
jgi:hypothetical protein